MKRSSTISESDKDQTTEKHEKDIMSRLGGKIGSVSTTTLTNVRVSTEQRSKSDPVQYFNISNI